MHPSNSRIGTCLTLALTLAACDSSIGRDTCLGIGTRCALDPVAGFRPPVTSLSDAELRTGALPSLMPVDVQQLTFPTPLYQGNSLATSHPLLSGNGRAGLFYARPRADGEAVEIYRLDNSGQIVDESLILAPSLKDAGSLAPSGARKLLWGGMRTVQNQGEAPILSISWVGGDCGSGVPCSVGDELVALRADLSEPCLRIFPPQGVPVHAASTNDGGVWLFGLNTLRKYDRDGEVVNSQSLFDHKLPYAITPGMVSPHLLSLISVTSSHGFYAWSYSEDRDALPELWSFDAQGSPRWRSGNESSDVAMLVDAEDRAVIVTTLSNGDLRLTRINATSDRQEAIDVLREDFTMLDLVSVTEDAAGNLYVLTHTGPRNHAIPTLCKLPLEGALACFLTPTLEGSQIIGADAGVIYASTTIDEHEPVVGSDGVPAAAESAELTLQRFEVP